MCDDEFFSTVPGLNTRISEINVSRSTVRQKYTEIYDFSIQG